MNIATYYIPQVTSRHEKEARQATRTEQGLASVLRAARRTFQSLHPGITRRSNPPDPDVLSCSLYQITEVRPIQMLALQKSGPQKRTNPDMAFDYHWQKNTVQ